jgi:MFS family permease
VLRAFGFGFAAVLLGVYLDRRGLSPSVIGVTLGSGVLVGALLGLVLARAAASVGRRAALAATGVLMAMAGLDLALGSGGWLQLAGVTGMLGAAGVDLGPFLAVEQSLLAESVPSSRRNRAFGRYSLTGGIGAITGSLAASLGTTTARMQVFFLLYAVIGLITAVLAAALSRAVDRPTARTLSRASVRPLAALSALFALDSLGGGLVALSVIAYWLHVRFGAGSQVLGPAFAGIAVLQAISYEAATRLADRIGLVRTMVFTHLPSNVLLMLVPLSPSLPWAIVLLLARFSISQMDVPARQAYIVSIVPPEERAAAVAVTGAVRGVTQAAGPALAGLAIQAAALGFPFFLAGSLKICYDLLLYAGFRERRADHEVADAARITDV